MNDRIDRGSKVSFFAKGKRIVGIVTALKTKHPGRNKLVRRGLGHLVRGVECAVIAPVDNPTMFWTCPLTNLKLEGKVKGVEAIEAMERVNSVKENIRHNQRARANKNYTNLNERGLLDWQKGLKAGDKVMVKYSNRYSLVEETFVKFSRPGWKIGIRKWNGKARYLSPQIVTQVPKK